MRRMVTIWLVLLALVASACGDGSGSDADDVVVGEDDTPGEDEGPDDDGPEQGLEPAAQLAAALETAGTVTNYRLEVYQGQILEVPGINIRDTRPLDRSAPFSVAIVDGDRLYVEMDVGAAFGDALPFDELVMRMWQTDDELVVDTSSYQQLVDLDPTAQLGPFRPGFSRIDLAAVEAESTELVEAILGSGSPELDESTAAVIEALDDVEVLDDGRTFRGAAAYGALIEAQGNDVDTLARSLAGGLALNLGVDVEALTEFYAGLYANAPTDVVVRLDDQGVLAEIEMTTDLSALYTNMTEFLAGVDPTADADLLGPLFADGRFKIEILQVVDLTPAALPEAPTDLEDRTQEWVDFMRASGFDG